MNLPRWIDDALAALWRRVDQLEDREAAVQAARQSRLARTVVDPSSGYYPNVCESPNTYWVVFVDGSFTETQGAQTPAFVERQSLPGGSSSVGLYSAGRVLAQNLAEGESTYVEQGEVIEVFNYKGQWWFYYVTGPPCEEASSSYV